ncbi:MAG: DUF4065 domain-containing protein [Bacteroidetes bacterium]|nr:DUF4065 domain-containing protein [Bacteroidota bacterium]
MEQSNKGKYNSVEVAKYIAAYWNENGAEINMTKLQKLLYIAYGTWLAVKNERLVDEHPQAWPYGPVFPTTRNKLSNIDLKKINTNDNEFQIIKNDLSVNKLLSIIFNTFGDWNASKLSEWSHKNGSPWYYTTQMPDFKWGDQIDDITIQEYFSDVWE